MRTAILTLLSLLLAACQAPEPQQNADNASPAEQTSKAEGPAKPFVGHWAASKKACETIAWEVTQTRLSTPGAVTCDFEDVNRVSAGYEIAATCFAEAPPAPYNLKLSRTESADGLLIEDGPFNPIRLVACDKTT